MTVSSVIEFTGDFLLYDICMGSNFENGKATVGTTLNFTYVQGPLTFTNAYPKLITYLDKIRSEAPKGKSAPPSAKAMPGTTDTGAKAYSIAYDSAKKILDATVNNLTVEQLGYLSGLEYRDPNDEKLMREDVTNSILSSWDLAASKYMKNEIGAGDEQKTTLFDRVQEFDTAISSKGQSPVAPD